MHKRDLRKQIYGLESAAMFAARFYPKAWPDGPHAAESFILDAARRLLRDDAVTSIVTGGLKISRLDKDSFEVWVDPSKWSEN